MEQKYYIQHIGDYAWDYILWWRPDSRGYTYNLKDAGLYSASEAEGICRIRGLEQAWPEEFVKHGIESAVTIEKLNRAGLKPSFAPDKIARRKKGRIPQFHHCTSGVCLAFKDLAEARAELLACYRLGRPPTEALLNRIDRAFRITAEHGALLHTDKTENPKEV